MKKTLLSLILCLTFISSHAGDRNVLIERFTSSTCGPCASNNPTMDAFLATQDPDNVTGIAYHMNWPAPGNDPFFASNPTDNGARRTYYNINSIPDGRMDGSLAVSLPYTQAGLQSQVDSRLSIISPITILVRDSVYQDTMLVNVEIRCELPLSSAAAIVYIALVEKRIEFASPPGVNGERIFTDVLRLMGPNANGLPVTLIPGQVIKMQHKFKLNSAWPVEQLHPVVFVQDLSKQIINSGVKANNFSLIANPIVKSVNATGNNADYKLFIPYKASTFTGPVTFTAENVPAGIDVSFPNGNSISNFNDSLSVKLTATSASTGEYSVVIKGTGSNGKTKKTIITLLVNKNYIVTGTNKNDRTYKVDNVSYTRDNLFVWNLNTNHTLEAVTPQLVGTSIQYVFTNWSNGSTNPITNITANSNENLYRANYKTQYKLISKVLPNDLPVTIPVGNIFHDSASTITLGVSAQQVQHNGKTYYFQRWEGTGNGAYIGNNVNGQLTLNNVVIQTAVYDAATVGISNNSTEIPAKFSLYQNYPNPFNPATTVKFDIPQTADVKLVVYDITGKEVANLYNGMLQAGSYNYSWDASQLPSGMYFCKINAGSFSNVIRMVLVK